MDNLVLVPSRLKEARESCGLSMSELSEIVGVTSQAISEYERGTIKPSIFVLKKIANGLEFPISFFSKPTASYTCPNSAVYFRSMKTTPKKIKIAYTYRIAWGNEILTYFKKFIEFSELKFPSLKEYTDGFEFDDYEIENVALKLREYWKLGEAPIDNLVEVVEDNGILVCGISFKNKKIEAFSQWFNGQPYIFYGSNRESCVSLRFSIAHELGHLILHPNITMDDIFKKSILDKIEDEANKFAAAFLLPSVSFSREVRHNSLEYLLLLKEKWRVSLSAMIKRCGNLGLFSENQISYLNRQMTMRQYWRSEPLDDEIEIEKPSILQEAIEMLLDNKIITPKKLLDDLSLPKNEILSICTLDANFFEKEKEKEERIKLRIMK